MSENFLLGESQKCQKMNQESAKMSENESRNCKNVRKYFRAAKNHEDLFIFLTFLYFTNFLTFLDPISDIVTHGTSRVAIPLVETTNFSGLVV